MIAGLTTRKKQVQVFSFFLTLCYIFLLFSLYKRVCALLTFYTKRTSIHALGDNNQNLFKT